MRRRQSRERELMMLVSEIGVIRVTSEGVASSPRKLEETRDGFYPGTCREHTARPTH